MGRVIKRTLFLTSMASFWESVNKVIDQSDVLLLLLDSRMVEETRNLEIEDKVNALGKPLIYVVSKCDLVSKEYAEKYKKILKPCVFVSAKEFHGITMLFDKIGHLTKNIELENDRDVVAGVLGYPNVGKSSLINALRGKKSAKTSIMSGHTRGIQKIRVATDLMILDSPGVIPYKEKDTEKHAMIGSIDYTKSKEPDLAVMKLIEEFPRMIEDHYGVEPQGDSYDTLEELALKKNCLIKGGEPDVDRVSRMILRDWQSGKIRQ